MTSPTPARPRILMVVQRFFPEMGGLETHVAEVASRLAAGGEFDVTVLTTDRSGRLARTEERDGYRIRRRRSWPAERDYYLSPGLAVEIARGDYDLVHVQGVHTFVPPVAMAAARASGTPYVLTFHSGGHSSPSRRAVRSLQWRLLAPLLGAADRLIAVSRFERTHFAESTGIDASRFTVVANGGALPPVAQGVSPKPGRIVSSGRLERYKGHQKVIEALPLVRQRIPDADLLILGSGDYEGELLSLADRLGVADAVEIRHLPPTDRASMARELGTASVMAALSSYEAHPVGVMEALTMGLPVVGLDVAGTGDLVEDELVIGIPEDSSPGDVADALSSAMEETARRPGPHRPQAIELPTWETTAAGVADVYREVLAGRRPHDAASQLDVVHVIASLTAGGAERQLEMLAARSRHRTRVVDLYGSGGIAPSVRAAGVPVEELRLGGWRKLVAPVVLARRLRRTRPDAVHVHLLSGQLMGITAARLARVPLVVSSEHSLMDSTIEGRPHSWWLRLVYRGLERLTSHTIAVSEVTSGRLQRWGVRPERISVADLGVDLEALAFDPEGRRQVREELAIGPDTRVVGAVGRLEGVKRMDVVLRACAPLLAEGAVLVVAGAGPLLDDLRRLAVELGVADQVRWLGSRDRIGPVLSAMDVLVSASDDETFGMAVVEALASGLPVVYAACPALEALPERLEHADHVLSGGGAAADAARLGVAVAARIAATGDRRWPVPESLTGAYGAQAAADRVDAVYDRLLTRRAD